MAPFAEPELVVAGADCFARCFGFVEAKREPLSLCAHFGSAIDAEAEARTKAAIKIFAIFMGTPLIDINLHKESIAAVVP